MPGTRANDRRGGGVDPGSSLVSPPCRSYGPNGRRYPRPPPAWREVADGDPGLSGCYEANAKMVVVFWVWPASSSVDGKLGWLGEFGKCWVSKVYAWPWR